MLKLYQFPISHYCEKVRWVLDYKGLAWQPVNLLPGLHTSTMHKLGVPETTTPVLVDSNHNQTIQGSDRIIDYLESISPDYPLTPTDPEAQQAAQAWESLLDQEIGVTLRQFFYIHLLPERNTLIRLLAHEGPWYGKAFLHMGFGSLKSRLRKSMNLYPKEAEPARQRLERIFRQLDEALSKNPFLVSNRFSRADLTASALLSPMCRPPQRPYALDISFPAALEDFIDQHRQAAFFEWVLENYQQYRQPKQTY